MYKVDIIADSVSPLGYRLTTLTATYPRFIHEELLTHKDFSRGSASSRAIPTARLLEMVRTNPAMPAEWGTNRPGMQSYDLLSEAHQKDVEQLWLKGRDHAVEVVEHMLQYNVHKQCINRILQPYMWMTVVITSTQWEHFFSLRDHPAADPTFQKIARIIRDAYKTSVPKELKPSQWHLPYITGEECTLPLHTLQNLSAARCARVSFMKPGEAYSGELVTAKKMLENGHWSPFEHQAWALQYESDNHPAVTGNLKGWGQLRKMLHGEYRHQPRYTKP